LARAPGKTAAAARIGCAQGAVRGHEYVLGDDRLAAGAAHAEHVPIVDNLVLRLVQQTHAVIDHALALAHHRRELAPLARVDAAGEIPAPADAVSARDAARVALRVGDPRGDEHIRIFAPYFLLGALVVQRQHPVVHGRVDDVPTGRSAAAADLRRNVEVGDEIQFHAAVTLGLEKAEQAAAVQVGFGFREHAARRFGALGALPQCRHQFARAAQGFIQADVGEAARASDRQVHRRGSATRGIAA